MNGDRIVFCKECGARYAVRAEVWAQAASGHFLLCSACGHGSPPSSGVTEDAAVSEVAALDPAISEAAAPRIIVGHAVPAAQRSIADALRRAGYAPVCVRSGDQVLAACDPAMPVGVAAVVLDVAIASLLAFEVIEGIRSHPATKHIPVILLASVYERTRYKRRPNRLYGADAYLELHHVPDRLVEIVERLVAHDKPPDERLQAPVERARAHGLRSGIPVDDVWTAQVLARRLLSDVALYHGDEIAAGIRSGAPFMPIKDAVGASREIFLRAAAEHGDVFEDELSSFASRLLERGPRRTAVRGDDA